MQRFQYFTVSVGLVTDHDGDFDREEVFNALRDSILDNREGFQDDNGIEWTFHSFKDES